jgi:AraC-like DNA-binding protein
VYNHKFSISFISRGNFYYHTFCEQLDAYTGYALISKPDYEYRVTHPTEEADECSVFSFSLDFYKSLEEQLPYNTKWFFNNKDIQSMLIKLTPEIEYLHKVCIHAIENNMPALYVDALVIEIVQQLLQSLNQETTQIIVSDRLKKSHIITIELAKNYILQNFTTDISLKDIAAHSFVSPFHFSRIFKTITGTSPYNYLQTIRLAQASLLLKSNKTIAEAAFASGFNRLDYFSAAFKQKYKVSPSSFSKK